MKKKKGKTADTDGDVKKDDEEQSRKFIETAKQYDSDKAVRGFKKTIDRLKK